MSKMEILNSYMMKRLAVAAREILEAVEATVTEYRAETAQTRIENEKLKQQLRELLTPVTEPVQNASKPVSEEMSSCGQQEWNSVLEKQAELLEDQQSQNQEQSECVFRKKSPQKVIQACKKDPDSEIKTVNMDACTDNPPSESTEMDIIQQVAVPVVKLRRVKLEQEDARIPISLPDTDLPKDSSVSLSHSYSSEPTQITLSPSRGSHNTLLSEAPEREESQNPVQMNVRASPEKVSEGVHGELIYKCSQCRKTFAELDKLQVHQKMHKRTYGCHWCGKSFYQSADLRRHLRTHTGERPYLCTWCSKSFSQRSNLRRHVRIHTGERPYRCAHCDHSFSDSHTLKKHQRKHYEQRYSCTVCDQSFTMARSLQLHLVRQHLVDKGSQLQVGFRNPV